ncbi:hypothetical protein HYC85_015336 [Camellia sinensis]|uniref:Alpha-1,4 glucan phosphorylase n=1 Tax=Camellia sinensis TaxID=4442 RepID=A0A7J7H0D6_CAMSI|nr:hypothetical protein HYC85_015336 [Camellia sinensis]
MHEIEEYIVFFYWAVAHPLWEHHFQVQTTKAILLPQILASPNGSPTIVAHQTKFSRYVGTIVAHGSQSGSALQNTQSILALPLITQTLCKYVAIFNLCLQANQAKHLTSGGEKDAALGNGGLGRLASCFLDSMATLNLPAWGYGLRYIYGLFKQRFGKEGQEEIKFSHWEVVRHDIVFPVRFFGQVEVHPSGSRKWVGGEVVQALAYDVPIPGYKTKNTINLHLWEAKAGAEDFNPFQFNDGQYESAAQLHFRAQQTTCNCNCWKVASVLICLSIVFVWYSDLEMCLCKFVLFFILGMPQKMESFCD